jgi:hypothetical protein
MNEPEKEYSKWERLGGLGSGSITNHELREIFKETKNALPFLYANRKNLGFNSYAYAIMLLQTLKGYAKARKMRGIFEIEI